MDINLVYEKIWRELPYFSGYYGNIYGDVVSMKSGSHKILKVYGKEPNQYVYLQNTNCKREKVYLKDVAYIVNKLGYLHNISETFYSGSRRSKFLKYDINTIPQSIKDLS